MPADNPDLTTIVGEALEQTEPAARSAYLDRVCGADDALRQRVEALLAAHAGASRFLEPDAAGALDATSPGPTGTTGTYAPDDPPAGAAEPTADYAGKDERAGAVIAGKYTLVKAIGEGGMGSVWRARQTEPVKRYVALKLIKAGMDSRQVLARFEAERQALALMDHPNIAKVLDGGLHDRRPFFVMELVKGVPITEYCDGHKLTPRERLELFIPVCQAIQHAHQKGIIHRDIKPSNVLIALYDDKPVVKVIDFGVAKATGGTLTEQTIDTGFGGVIGTPQYMSPEQAGMSNLDIDTRSDVYSLGVLLYELLTGTTPFTRDRFKKAAYDEIRRIIREEEPPKPSTRLSESTNSMPSISAQRHMEPTKLKRLVRGELDWIVMKALDKNRNRRYETATSFALDVQRYLNAEPVLAGPPSTRYRLRKYAQKHFKVLATAALFVGLLVAATATSTILAAWALRERGHAEKEKQSAETNLKRALDAVNQMLTRVSNVQLLNVPQMAPVRRQLLLDALGFYQEFLKEKSESPVVRSEAANVYRRLGMIQHQLGQPKEAEESYRQAILLGEKLRAEAPNDPVALEGLAFVHNDLGIFYQQTQQYARSEEAFKLGMSLREQLDRLDPTYSGNRANLAGLYSNLTAVYRMMGQLNQAEAAYQKCRALTEDILRSDPNNINCLINLGAGHLNMGLVYGAMDRRDDAEAAHLKAADIFQRLIRDQPEVVDYQKRLASTYNNLGLFHANNRNHAKAEAAYKQSIALHESIARDHPKVVPFQVDVGISCTNMATHIRRSRSAEESLPWSARAIEIAGPVLEKDPQNGPARGCLFDAYFGRASAMQDLKRPEEAAKDWKRLLDLSADQPNITMRLFRPSALAHRGEYVQAAAEMETLLAEGKVPPLNLFIFSYVYARCVGAVAKDARLSPAEQERLADRYGARSVGLLKKAQAAGYFDDPARLARMKGNEDFNPIRAREDFKKLLAEFEKVPSVKPPTKP